MSLTAYQLRRRRVAAAELYDRLGTNLKRRQFAERMKVEVVPDLNERFADAFVRAFSSRTDVGEMVGMVAVPAFDTEPQAAVHGDETGSYEDSDDTSDDGADNDGVVRLEGHWFKQRALVKQLTGQAPKNKSQARELLEANGYVIAGEAK